MSPLRTKEAIQKMSVTVEIPEFILVAIGDSVMRDRGNGFWLDDMISANERYRSSVVVDLAYDGALISDVIDTLEDDLAPYANPSGQCKLLCFLGTGINGLATQTASQVVASMETGSGIIRAAGGLSVAFNSPGRNAGDIAYNALLKASYEAGNFDFYFDLFVCHPTVMPPPDLSGVHPDVPGNLKIAADLAKTLRGEPLEPIDYLVVPAKTSISISSISVASSAVVTSATHGLTTGDYVSLTGTNSTPSLNGVHQVTVLSSTTFSVPVTTTVSGSSGSVNKGVSPFSLGEPSYHPRTWLIQCRFPNSYDTEAFLATSLYAHYRQGGLLLHSIAYQARDGTVASPILETVTIYNDDNTSGYFILNKSTDQAVTILPKLMLAMDPSLP